MNWDKLTIQNFLSIEYAEIILNNRGLVLVEGFNKTSPKFKSNGSGKTSIFESIVYVLYDTTTKGLKADEVINNKTTKKNNCAVILEGHRGDDHYIIERYRKHTKYKNKVRLILNGQDISEKSTADTNKAIQQIIGMDYNTFVNSILFSQGNGAGRFAVATDKEKKEILENLVNLQIYAKSQDIAKDKIKATDNKILEKKREVERSQWELAQVDTLEEQDNKNYEATKHLIIKTDVDLRAAQAELTAYRDGNAVTVEQAKARIATLELQRDRHANINISSESENVENLRNGLQRVQNEINQADFQKADLVKKYKQIELNTKCPVCGNDLDAAHREEELNSIKDKLREVLMQIKVLNSQLVSVQPVYEKAKADLDNKRKIYENGNSEYRQIVQEIETQKKIISDYNYYVQVVENRASTISNKLDELRAIPEPTSREEDRNTLREKIKVQKVELLALEKHKTDLEDVVKTYSDKGVKSYILDFITPFLNEHGNKYLNALAGPDMELVFNTQTENKDGSFSDKFDVKLLNASGGDEYKGNSGGEQKRADLSITLALQDYVLSRAESSFNFVVYDEIFDALDEVGSENTITLLRERLKTVPSIFVVTHNEHLKALFEQVMTVTKGKDGISTIREGEETS